jgi:DNA-binding IclR family transcriptional regulator
MQTTKSIPAIERALAILEALDNSAQSMNIAELSRKLAIPRSTAHSIALTLERCGYVTRDASRRNCMLSMKAYRLGREAAPSGHLADTAFRPMKSLSTATQLTSHLAVLDLDQAVYVQKVQGLGLLRFDTHIGKRTNLHCTGVGKVLLSYAPQPYQEKYLKQAPFARYTRNTITTASALRRELAKITKQSFALDDQEEELDVRCLSVPVFNVRGEFIAALSVSGSISQLKEDWLPTGIDLLQKVARQIGTQSGSDLARDAS